MFEAHGSYEVEVSGNILFVTARGAWNKETAEAYRLEVMDKAAVIVGQPWGLVSLMDDWELFTPDCLPVMNSLSKDALISGLKRDAMVNRTESVKMQVFPKSFEKFPNFQREFFQTKQQALVWLAEEGFKP